MSDHKQFENLYIRIKSLLGVETLQQIADSQQKLVLFSAQIESLIDLTGDPDSVTDEQILAACEKIITNDSVI